MITLRLLPPVAIALFASILMKGCGCGSVLAEDDPAFAGFPTDVVAEQLADPAFQHRLSLEGDDADRVEVAQLIISKSVFCRDILTEYQAWVLTGNPPTIPSLVVPHKPAAGFTSYMNEYIVEEAKDATRSGDPTVLRSWMLLAGKCGDIAVDPSMSEKLTISDFLEGKK